MGVDWEQTVCPNTSAALKEKKTRRWESTQPVSDMANDNYSSCFKVGHLGSCSLPPSQELLVWSFGGLSQLAGQHEDARLTGVQDLSTGTVDEGASSAATLPAHAWGSKCAVTHLLLFGDQRPLPWPTPGRCYLGVCCWRRLGGRSQVELVLKKLKRIVKNPKNTKPSPQNNKKIPTCSI